MEQLKSESRNYFLNTFHKEPDLYSQTPGRINIIGEHTDYTHGYSLPAAINRWTICAWKKRDDNLVKIYSSVLDEFWETSLNEIQFSMGQLWKKYVGGSLLSFQEKIPLQGFELSIHSNIPLEKGLSSSASIELSIINGLNELFSGNLTSLEMSLMAQQVEHQYLELQSGLMDQLACQLSKKDHAVLIDFNSLNTKDIAIHPNFKDYNWVLVDSLVKRTLATSKYSERVTQCSHIIKNISKMGLNSFRDLTIPLIESLEIPPLLKRRALHIVSENQRTLKTSELLEKGLVKELGTILLESHQSLSENYEVSHPNLDFIVQSALSHEGVLGGRMMGGGFGGCCLFLVSKSSVKNFSHYISKVYEDFSQMKTEAKSFHFVKGSSTFRL